MILIKKSIQGIMIWKYILTSHPCWKNSRIRGIYVCIWYKSTWIRFDTIIFHCKEKWFFYKVRIQCNDDKGIYHNGQWYTHVTTTIHSDDSSLSQISTTDFRNLTNVIALPLIENVDMNNSLYAFVTDTWLCRSWNGNMCLPTIASELILKIKLI